MEIVTFLNVDLCKDRQPMVNYTPDDAVGGVIPSSSSSFVHL